MKSYLYPIVLLLVFILNSTPAEATHWRGGYIHYTLDKQNPLKAYFTMTAFTKSSSPADEPIVNISMGDGINLRVDRFSKTAIEPDADINLYKWEYTFPSAGTYTISWSGVNRNGGILNLPAPTDQIGIAIKTEIKINPLNPNRHGVQIKRPLPIMAYTGTPMRFNLLAYDPDGDSLGYELIAPLHWNSQNVITAVPGYTVPERFGINQFGEMYWEKPSRMGEYNHAVRITQYRKGQAIGHTIFDMQFLLIRGGSQYAAVPELQLENKDELTFLKDGRLLVKPGEKVTLRLLHNPYPTEVIWQSELKEEDVEVSVRRVSEIRTEFSFIATKALSRRQAYGINLDFLYVIRPDIYLVTFTLPILIWEPVPIELALTETENLPLTPEGHISSKPGSAVKLLIFAKNGLGHNTDLMVESSLRKDAELFSFVTRDSADSQVGELIFKPSENQISATPYTITLRNTSMQLRTSTSPVATQELTLQVLVSAAMPTSSGENSGPDKLKVYPNPVNKQFTLEAPDLPSLLLQLYDINGSVIARQTLQPGQNVIARPPSLAAGLYFYTLTSRDKSVSSGKLVLQ